MSTERPELTRNKTAKDKDAKAKAKLVAHDSRRLELRQNPEAPPAQE